MIKKCFGWFDVYYAEMLLGVTLAIYNACIGSWSVQGSQTKEQSPFLYRYGQEA